MRQNCGNKRLEKVIGVAKKITPNTTGRFKGNLEDDAQNTKLVHKLLTQLLIYVSFFLLTQHPKDIHE